MPVASVVSEEMAMFEPLIGLAVAIVLGVYLIVTLIRPERF
jgi:K+-transporting ATPase KdpF subunit